jgi:hypothetical protein
MPPFQENGTNVRIFAAKAKEHLPAIFDIQQICFTNMFAANLLLSFWY